MCDHSPSAGAAVPSCIYAMGPTSQMTWKEGHWQTLLCHGLGKGRIFRYWSDFLITRGFGLTYSIWLDFCLSSGFMVLAMLQTPSQGEDEGTMSAFLGLSRQHPRACRSGEDAAAPAARWGLLSLLQTLQEISVLSLPLR